MYAKRLILHDLKCFKSATMTLRSPLEQATNESDLPNINVILGINGGGKSTVLRALGLGVLSPILPFSGYVPYRLVRRPSSSKMASISLEVELTDVERTSLGLKRGKVSDAEPFVLETKIIRGAGSIDKLDLRSKNPLARRLELALEVEKKPTFFIVGYGATRRVDTGGERSSRRSKIRGPRYERVGGLFEDDVNLRPLSDWLNEPKYKFRRSEVAKLIDYILPDDVTFAGKWDEREQQFEFGFNGRSTPFPALSDGYKAFVGWVGDLVGQLASVCPKEDRLDNIPGIVLVDEVDLNLHPEWQRRVVPQIAKAFPKLQFVLTTHSPIVASSVRSQSVFVTETDNGGLAQIKQYEESLFGRNADEVLLSSYFGLNTTRATRFEDESKDLMKKVADGDRKAAITFLSRLVPPDTKKTASFRRLVAHGKTAKAKPKPRTRLRLK